MRPHHLLLKFAAAPGSTALVVGMVCAVIALTAWWRSDADTARTALLGTVVSIGAAHRARRLEAGLARFR